MTAGIERGGRELADALARVLPADRLVLDPDVLTGLSRDMAAWAPAGAPAAGVRAESEADVSAVVTLCADLRVPLVVRGAGTGLSGGANAVDGCVLLDVSRMTNVDIDVDNLTATVQPGVVNHDLKAMAAANGLWYPPDPASAPWSTIGGNVATNAGGLCCLKYGVTRDYVLGMRAVVGGPAGYGTAVKLGRRTSKGVAGLDVAGLMVGSEGVLGVITEITLRLRPAQQAAARTVVGCFPSLEAAGDAVAHVTRAGLVPSILELIDQASLRAVESWKRLGLDGDAAALLLARVDVAGAQGEADCAEIVRCFEGAGATWAVRSTDEVEAEALFEARRLVFPAMERLGVVHTEDVCVPRSQLPTMLAAVEKIAARHDIRIATVAHAGDGNLHPLIVTAPGDEQATERAHLAFEELLDTAIGLGGTVTGEHGVGLLKLKGMRRELDPGALELMRAVKEAFDPLGIFNPGKAL